MKAPPHSSHLRRGRFEIPGTVYFITASFLERGRPLDPIEVDVVLDALEWLRAEQRAHVFAFVVMPDHVHALLQPLGAEVIRSVMKSWKGFTGRRINVLRGTNGSVWQEGFYDRAMRDEQEVRDTLRYVHENPVEAGLVARPEDYAASSAHPSRRRQVDPL